MLASRLPKAGPSPKRPISMERLGLGSQLTNLLFSIFLSSEGTGLWKSALRYLLGVVDSLRGVVRIKPVETPGASHPPAVPPVHARPGYFGAEGGTGGVCLSVTPAVWLFG